MVVAFFGVRRASGVAQLVGADVRINEEQGVVHLEARRQKNDQYGAGQMARLVSMGTWVAACPVQHLSGWPWLGSASRTSVRCFLDSFARNSDCGWRRSGLWRLRRKFWGNVCYSPGRAVVACT